MREGEGEREREIGREGGWVGGWEGGGAIIIQLHLFDCLVKRAMCMKSPSVTNKSLINKRHRKA